MTHAKFYRDRGPSSPRYRLICPFILVLAAVGLASAAEAQQQRDLTGVVKDERTGEGLPNALVHLEGRSEGTLTDSYGRFSLLGIPAGDHTLLASRLGYAEARLFLGADQAATGLVINLSNIALEIEGVTATADAGQVIETGTDAGEIIISPTEIAKLPSLGEPDVLRSVQLLPGVSAANDASSGLYVRGGTPDQNLVLLDGMTVYHVDHFFGVFSAFNPDAIKDITMHKGGFSARYGGRTSSVVELVGKSGDRNQFRASGGLNLLSGRTLLEVPIGGMGTWLVSARRSYTDILRTPLYDQIFGALEGTEATTQGGGPGRGGGFNFQQQTFVPSFHFYDVNTKATFWPTSRDIASISVYAGSDHLDQSQSNAFGQGGFFPGDVDDTLDSGERIDLTDWGNRGISGRWSRLWSSRFTSDILVSGTVFNSSREQSLGLGGGSSFEEENRVNDVTLRLDNTYTPLRSHETSFGVWVTRNEVDYSLTRALADSTDLSLSRPATAAQAAGYLEDHWSPHERIDLTLGVRATHYDGTAETYVEPRTSFRLGLTDRLSLKGAWGKFTQFVNRVESEDVLQGSREFWLLADSTLLPSSAEHRVLGFSYETDSYLLDLEGYHKPMENVTEFSQRVRFGAPGESDQFFYTGSSDARGIDVLLQKKTGAATGWLSYTLGKVESTFEAFDNGEPFPASHDRRHEVNAVANYTLGGWTLSSNWIYATGKAYTSPESQYTLTLLDGSVYNYIHVGAKNAARLPDYHRLDVALTRRWETTNYSFDLNFSVFNVYNRDNVWYRQFDLDQHPIGVTDVSTLGITPSIGLSIGMN